MRTRIFWGSFALIAFLLLIPIGISFYNDWRVYNYGSIVKTKLVAVPRASPGYIKFQFDDRIYSKRISGYFKQSLRAGDTLQLKFLNGYEGHFLFADENPLSWDISVIIMILFLGGACLYYTFKKNPPTFKVVKKNGFKK